MTSRNVEQDVRKVLGLEKAHLFGNVHKENNFDDLTVNRV